MSSDSGEGIGCMISLILAIVFTTLTVWSLVHEFGGKALLAAPVIFVVVLFGAMGAWSGIGRMK